MTAARSVSSWVLAPVPVRLGASSITIASEPIAIARFPWRRSGWWIQAATVLIARTANAISMASRSTRRTSAIAVDERPGGRDLPDRRDAPQARAAADHPGLAPHGTGGACRARGVERDADRGHGLRDLRGALHQPGIPRLPARA